jgi:hypothetical protein
MVILATGSKKNVLYSDDSNVLGLSGLNVKRAIRESQKRIGSYRDSTKALAELRHFNAIIKVGQPETNIHAFNGLIRPSGFPTSVNFGTENLLLKESRIHHTPWVIGLLVYTGNDSKTQANI